jgi:hypothetical protein
MAERANPRTAGTFRVPAISMRGITMSWSFFIPKCVGRRSPTGLRILLPVNAAGYFFKYSDSEGSGSHGNPIGLRAARDGVSPGGDDRTLHDGRLPDRKQREVGVVIVARSIPGRLRTRCRPPGRGRTYRYPAMLAGFQYHRSLACDGNVMVMSSARNGPPGKDSDTDAVAPSLRPRWQTRLSMRRTGSVAGSGMTTS